MENIFTANIKIMPLKLYCAKISHDPEYKEELVEEIPEKIIQVDGYEIAERLLEGLLFDVKFDDTDKVTEVYIENDTAKKWFEGNFNHVKFYKEVEKYVNDILKDGGDEVEIPKILKDKYFTNGRNCSYIA